MMATAVAAATRPVWRALPPAPLPAPSTGDRLVYAIGDVHGRYDLLATLLGAIAADAESSRRHRLPVLVLCGDYIDRGPHSAQVLEAIRWLEAAGRYELRALRGNHEQSCLDFIDDPAGGGGWLRHGGQETLRSYGVDAPEPGDPAPALARARDALLGAMPAGHLRLMQRTMLWTEIGGYLFVHAGIRPGVSIERQRDEDLLWIRGEFLDFHDPHPRTIVHGHSWDDETIQLMPNRIGIDTGAFATDVLTALRLDGTARAYLQARPIAA